MKVWLKRKLAECIDGVDISDYRVGDTLELPTRDASLLVAEEWAEPERRIRDVPPSHPQRRAVDAERLADRLQRPQADRPSSDASYQGNEGRRASQAASRRW
jgi:hypothetical protein